MSAPVDRILEQLKQGQSLFEIRLGLLTPGERAALRLCATARSFDRDVLESVVGPVLKERGIEADLDSLAPESGDGTAARGDAPVTGMVAFLEPAPTPGCSRVRAEFADLLFDDWWRGEPSEILVPEPLQAFSERLADHYGQRGDAWKHERLYHLIAANPDEAGALFDGLFAEADERFDLAACENLVRLVEQRRRLLADELIDLKNDARAYLEAREFASREYFQTVRYYERGTPEERFGSFLEGGPAWLFHVHAPGGRGKTMFLRWAVSRRCVPRPWRIPVARVDFDDIKEPPGTADSWLLALYARVIDQLDRQLPNRPLLDLARRLGDQLKDATISGGSDLAGLVRETREDLGDILRSQLEDRAVVLLFDTLEEATLHYELDLKVLVDELALLRKRAPRLRGVLAGRYRLVDPGQPLAGLPEGDLVELPIAEFEDHEARGYLTDKRKIADAELVEAIVGRADRNPFKLALFADIVTANPKITARKILDYPSVDLAYLVERVLKRIRNPKVRWLLRYGVVPRRLGREFLSGVVASHLKKAMTGDVTSDDPARDAEELQEEDSDTRLFRTDLLASIDEPLKLETLWAELEKYAAKYSWVSPAQGEAGVLVFHPEVANPMRSVLRKHEVFEKLHSEAADHFLGRAEADGPRRAKWLGEAVYHWFQRDGAVAGEFWRGLMRDAAQDAGLRRSLAREVLGLEYLDEEGAPRVWRDDVPLVDRATVAEAWFERAAACVDLARLAPEGERSELMGEARSALNRVDGLLGGAAGAHIAPASLARVRAAVHLADGNKAAARAALTTALDDAVTPEERVSVLVDYAASVAAEDPEKALEYLFTARTLFDEASFLSPVRRYVATTLASLCRKTERFEEALAQFEYARRLAEEDGDAAAVAGLTLDKAEVALRLGRLSGAFDYVSVLDAPSLASLPGSGPLAARLARLRVEVHLARRDPPAAIDSLRSHTEYRQPEMVATLRECTGAILDEVGAADPALSSLQSARGYWREIGVAEGTYRCALREAAILVRGRESAEEGMRVLDHVFAGSVSDADQIEIAILRARAASDPRRAVADLLDLFEKTEESKTTTKARLAVEVLALGSARAADFRRASDAIERLESPLARLVHARELARCAESGVDARGAACGLDDALAYSVGDGWDAPALALAKIDSLRVAGRGEKAWGVLDAAMESFARAGSVFPLRELLRAADRVGWDDRDPEGYTLSVGKLVSWSDEALARSLESLLGATGESGAREFAVGIAREFAASAAADHVVRSRRRRGSTPTGSLLDGLLPGNLRGLATEPSMWVDAVERAIASHTGAHTIPEADGEPEARAGTVDVQVRDSGRLGLVAVAGDQSVGLDPRAMSPALRELFDRPTPLIPSAFAKEALSGWENFLGNLHSLLSVARASGATPDPAFVHLSTSGDRIAALPWELVPLSAFARPKGETLLYRRIGPRVGGAPLRTLSTPGASVFKGIRRFLESRMSGAAEVDPDPRSRPVRVLLLRTSLDYDVYSQRATTVAAVGVDLLYARARCELEVVDEPTLSTIERVLRSRDFDVVHVCASYSESQSLGGVYADFFGNLRRGASSRDDRSDAVTPDALGRILLAIPEPQRKTVVLDMMQPPDSFEGLVQLCLRNAFAWRLAESGACRAVLATGFTSYAAGLRLLDTIVSGIASRDPALRLVRKVRTDARPDYGARLRTGDPEAATQLFGRLGTALFCKDPTLPIV
jgi:hypothetical protein